MLQRAAELGSGRDAVAADGPGGSVPGMIAWAKVLTGGVGTALKLSEAARWFRQAAAASHVAALGLSAYASSLCSGFTGDPANAAFVVNLAGQLGAS